MIQTILAIAGLGTPELDNYRARDRFAFWRNQAAATGESPGPK